MSCAHLSLCYVQFVAAGSPLRGSPLASLARLASQAKLAPVASLAKEGPKLSCQQYVHEADSDFEGEIAWPEL